MEKITLNLIIVLLFIGGALLSKDFCIFSSNSLLLNQFYCYSYLPFRIVRSGNNIMTQVNSYKEMLRKKPNNPALLTQLLADLSSSDKKKSLTAALVLVEQMLITEDQRLKCVKIIKQNYETYLDKPLGLKNMVDFHIHTFWSDAIGTPSEIIVNAWLQGMKAVGAVDHNGFDGILEAMKAAEVLGVKVIPGIEFDVVDESRGVKNMHIVAYFDKGNSEGFRAWLEEIKDNPTKTKLDEFRERYIAKTMQMLDKFNELEFKAEDGSGEILVLTDEDIKGIVGKTPNKYQLGDALFRKYGPEKLGVNNYRQAAQKYFKEELGTYIKIDPDGVDIDEVIKFALEQGGVLVIPHPTELTEEYGMEALKELLQDYAAVEIDGQDYLGFRGVEVYSYKTPAEERGDFIALLGDLNSANPIYKNYPLIITIGTDGHDHFDEFMYKIGQIQNPDIRFLEDLISQLQLIRGFSP